MADAMTEIVRRVVKHPYLLLEEMESLYGTKVNSHDIIDALKDLGLCPPSNREMLVHTRAGWEAIIATEIAQFTPGSVYPWFNNLTSRLEQEGLTHQGARLWSQEFLKQQLGVRIDSRRESDLRSDLMLLRDVARAETLPRLGHRRNIERAARFASWVAVRLITALSHEVAAEWYEKMATPVASEKASGIADAWVVFAVSEAFPDFHTSGALSDTLRQVAVFAQDGGFERSEVGELYQAWWSAKGGLPSDVGWTPLRRVCTELKQRASQMIGEVGQRWIISAAVKPAEKISRNHTFRERRGDISLLEVATGLIDRHRFRRCFAWQMMTLLEETVASQENVITVSDISQEIYGRWMGQPKIGDKLVKEFLYAHGCDTSDRLELFARFLRLQDVWLDLSPQDQRWLLEKLFLLLLRESMSLGIKLTNDFYDGLKQYQSESPAYLVEIFSGLTVEESRQALENALRLMGIERGQASPYGVRDWREWVERRENCTEFRLRELIRACLKESTTLLGANTQPVATIKATAVEQLAVVKQPILARPPVEQITEFQAVLNIFYDNITKATSLLGSLESWVQDASNKMDKAQIHQEQHQERIEEMTATVRAWHTEARNLREQLQTTAHEAVVEFLKLWNGEESRNSVLNLLFSWSRDDSNPKLTNAASRVLRRFEAVGIRAVKVEQVDKKVPLGDNAVDEWVFKPGTQFQEYRGEGFVLTPEWRYKDVILQKAWVDLP